MSNSDCSISKKWQPVIMQQVVELLNDSDFSAFPIVKVMKVETRRTVECFLSWKAEIDFRMYLDNVFVLADAHNGY